MQSGARDRTYCPLRSLVITSWSCVYVNYKLQEAKLSLQTLVLFPCTLMKFPKYTCVDLIQTNESGDGKFD